MRRYFFDIRSLNHAVRNEEGVQFQDDNAALNHVVWMIQRLKASGAYQDPASVFIKSVLAIPFYAACA